MCADAAREERPLLEFTVCDLRPNGERGLPLIERLIQADQLLAEDPAGRVFMLVRRERLGGAAADLRRRAAARQPARREQDLLLDLLFRPARARWRLQPSLARVLWEHLQATLARHGGNRRAAARALCITDNTLRRHLGRRPPE